MVGSQTTAVAAATLVCRRNLSLAVPGLEHTAWQLAYCPSAGKLFTRMNTAGKALASQVQQMQQQRAAQRAAAQAGGGGSMRNLGVEAPSPLRDGL